MSEARRPERARTTVPEGATGSPASVPARSAGPARWAYSAVLWLLKPAYLLKLWWRGRKEPLYRHAVGERWGRYGNGPSPQGALWVHAVSLGETRAAAALVEALRASRPGLRLVLTHGTATGREAGQALLREGDAQVWLPLDTPGAVNGFLRHFRPAVGVLMETEIWPNLLRAARAAGVPMVLANARLSERSLRRGQKLSALLQPAIESLALALAQTEADAERLRSAGARDVVVCGNLKFDMAPDPALWQRGRQWREAQARPVLMAAVTREGEEFLLLNAWLKQPEQTRGRLLIVPRHPQRFEEIASLVRQHGLSLSRRSTWAGAPDEAADEASVWLGDSIGEMPLYYGLADVALLGGSFAPLGGQNLIEAAACGCPVVMGPHTFNFAQAAELAIAAGAALRAVDMVEGVSRACHLLDADARAPYATRALAFAAAHRGAAGRMAERIAAWLPVDR
jgi:3-deoxy-D-manno-octulosonic-acid transferase